MGLPVADQGRQLGGLGWRNIRGVGDDGFDEGWGRRGLRVGRATGRIGALRGQERRDEVAVEEGQPVPLFRWDGLQVGFCHIEGLLGEVNGDDSLEGGLGGEGQGDGAGAGADVYNRALTASLGRDDELDEELGFGPGDQGVLCDFEVEVAEGGFADGVLEGHALLQLFGGRSDGLFLGLGEFVVGVGGGPELGLVEDPGDEVAGSGGGDRAARGPAPQSRNVRNGC